MSDGYQERALLQELGIDPEGIKSPRDFADALAPWVYALGEVRPDLLDQLAAEVIRGAQQDSDEIRFILLDDQETLRVQTSVARPYFRFCYPDGVQPTICSRSGF